jgi:hypothetical protein
MLRKILVLALAIVGALAASGEAATRPNSKISAFGGAVRGNVVLNIPGTTGGAGTTNGGFTVSRSRERGTLRLNSTITSGVFAGPFVETFQFQNRRLVYTLALTTGSGTGVCTARIGRSVISYSGSFLFLGTSYGLQGTIRQTRTRLIVQELVSSPGGLATFSYSLRRRAR